VTVGARIREAGDAALLLQLEAVIDPDVNARVIAIADAVRRRGLRGVRDVVSTFHSVAVYFDPLRTDLDEISAAIEDSVQAAPIVISGRRHTIPVAYGGEDGPDLDALAVHARMPAAQVIERHAGATYRVFMLGFQPGFAYMGLIDPSIAMPRRASPRLKVPAGSVGIAGRQTGVYPAASPGGWQIIGRALEPVFDPAVSPPARFAAGDTVVFVPGASGGSTPPRDASPGLDSGVACFTVLRPGLFTTIQDSGVWGEQGTGTPVSGALDPLSHAIANVAVGNRADAAALEVTIAGPELRVERETTIAVAGADLSATLDGAALRHQQAVVCQPGRVVRFGQRISGARAYLAVAGGLAGKQQLPARPVVAGQILGVKTSRVSAGPAMTSTVPLPSGGVRVRVMAGPQRNRLPAHCFEKLCSTRFIVSPQSNRIGYRLTGPPLPSDAEEMISDATFPGAIQVPPSGEPILLMADRQTTGGYPQVAVVISADVRMAGQLAPGDWIEFVPCSRGEARAALTMQQRMLSDAS
jgi:KipI family sensor histidine kinase inhibitor